MNDFLDDCGLTEADTEIARLRDHVRRLEAEARKLHLERDQARDILEVYRRQDGEFRTLAAEYHIPIDDLDGIVAAFRATLESALAGARSSAEAIARSKRAERAAGTEAHGWSLSAARLKVERDEAREKLEAVRAIVVS